MEGRAERKWRVIFKIREVPESEEYMILADKIIEMRKKNGWSQEELAGKLDVSRQSVSKWESAQSIPDMKRILMMAELFHVSTDYLLKDSVEDPDGEGEVEAEPSEDRLPIKKVSMQEANALLEQRNAKSNRVGLGVMLCILSPVPLLLLGEAGTGFRIGLVMLLAAVACAVGLFVRDNLAQEPFKDYETHALDTEYDVAGFARERREKYRKTHDAMIVAGVVLCVACAMPLIFSSLQEDGALKTDGLHVAILLVMAAIGVLCLAKSSIIWDGYHILLEEGNYSRSTKLENQRNSLLASVYWGAATAVYLIWSFVTFRWESTWIIWPIAGVAYGLLAAVLRIVRKRG